eukprot:TRINITY_DN3031_c0_g3_i1.p1 TRINITY_DN3031_c0_g3~~TRINITY_DN3031_c0_g3_i1.p1  ORF type:complete len:348 (+),score=34.25 TRINITY_DN3031_c0_g3_i1:69-1112(+)
MSQLPNEESTQPHVLSELAGLVLFCWDEGTPKYLVVKRSSSYGFCQLMGSTFRVCDPAALEHLIRQETYTNELHLICSIQTDADYYIVHDVALGVNQRRFWPQSKHQSAIKQWRRIRSSAQEIAANEIEQRSKDQVGGFLKYGDFGPVKGFVERGESELVAAIRECCEETFLEPSAFRVFEDKSILMRFDERRMARYYLCELLSTDQSHFEGVNARIPNVSSVKQLREFKATVPAAPNGAATESELFLLPLDEALSLMPVEYPERHQLYVWADEQVRSLENSNAQSNTDQKKEGENLDIGESQQTENVSSASSSTEVSEKEDNSDTNDSDSLSKRRKLNPDCRSQVQ